MGVKGVVVWLNGHGYRTRRAARWGIGPLHKLLTNPVYKGKAHFNRTDSKTRTAKPVLSTSSCRSIQSSTGYLRCSAGAAQGAQPKGRAAACGDRADPADRPRHLSDLRGRHDDRTGKSGRYRYCVCAADGAEGQGCLSGTLAADGTARRDRDRAYRHSIADAGARRRPFARSDEPASQTRRRFRQSPHGIARQAHRGRGASWPPVSGHRERHRRSERCDAEGSRRGGPAGAMLVSSLLQSILEGIKSIAARLAVTAIISITFAIFFFLQVIMPLTEIITINPS
jgi:hypothetical protein